MPNNNSKRAFDIHKTLPSQPKKPAVRVASDTLQESLPKKQRQSPASFIKRSIVSIILIVFLFIVILAVWDGIELSKASKKMFGSGNLFSLLGGSLATHNGRTNILIIGYSVDDPGHPGSTLTDSIMLASLDSNSKTGYLLSVPRDLWVNIPGFGYAKLNEAYQDGQRSGFNEDGYPAGGVGLLEKVVSDKLDEPIDYYALINYSAFRDTVNAVGGITVNIKSSDPRGLYDPNISPVDGGPLKLANGPQKLDGQTALNLARARGDSYYAYGFPQADFDRTEHQRQMLLALKQKAVSWNVILNPTKSGHLFDGMANNVKTDLNTGNVLPLFQLINEINVSNLKSESLRNLDGKNYLTDYGGALIPTAGIRDFSDIQAAINELNQ